MMDITLKPADFAAPAYCATFPDYVTNGQWMIRKARLVNAAVFASEALIHAFAPRLADRRNGASVRLHDTNDAADRIVSRIPEDTPVTWTIQPWIHVHEKTYGRARKPVATEAFIMTSTGRDGQWTHDTCFLARDYADRFGLRPGMVLYSNSDTGSDALITPDRSLVIMPVQRDRDEVLKPFRSIVHLTDLAGDRVTTAA